MFHGPLILPFIIVIGLNYLYTWPGVFVPLQALALVVFRSQQKESGSEIPAHGIHGSVKLSQANQIARNNKRNDALKLHV